MIKGITVSNGKTRLILVPENDVDKEVLKILDGATCKLITDNVKVFDQNVTAGLLIESTTREPLREASKLV